LQINNHFVGSSKVPSYEVVSQSVVGGCGVGSLHPNTIFGIGRCGVGAFGQMQHINLNIMNVKTLKL
jgi:hypothetical protein